MGLLVQEPALQKLIHHRLYLCQAVYLMKMDVLQDCVVCGSAQGCPVWTGRDCFFLFSGFSGAGACHIPAPGQRL